MDSSGVQLSIGVRSVIPAAFVTNANSAKKPGQPIRASMLIADSPVLPMNSTKPAWMYAVGNLGSSATSAPAPCNAKVIAAIWNSSRNLRSVLCATVTKNDTSMIRIAANALAGSAAIRPRPLMSAGFTPRSGPGLTFSARTYMTRPSSTSTRGSHWGALAISAEIRPRMPVAGACPARSRT